MMKQIAKYLQALACGALAAAAALVPRAAWADAPNWQPEPRRADPPAELPFLVDFPDFDGVEAEAELPEAVVSLMDIDRYRAMTDGAFGNDLVLAAIAPIGLGEGWFDENVVNCARVEDAGAAASFAFEHIEAGSEAGFQLAYG